MLGQLEKPTRNSKKKKKEESDEEDEPNPGPSRQVSPGSSTERKGRLIFQYLWVEFLQSLSNIWILEESWTFGCQIQADIVGDPE